MKKTTTPDSGILSNLSQIITELLSGHVQLLKTHSHVLTAQQNNATSVKPRGFDATNTTLDTLVHEFKVREERIDDLVKLTTRLNTEVATLSATVDMLASMLISAPEGTTAKKPQRVGKPATRKPVKIQGAVTKTARARLTKDTCIDPVSIIEFRKTKQLSQAKFAGWLNTTSGNISNWERGAHMVRPSHSKLARSLGKRMKDSGVPIKTLTEKEFNIRYR
tara:strand:+ start:2405 stop:3067 length:663 start_codon:yes stop_codon:yes gene_type:complete